MFSGFSQFKYTNPTSTVNSYQQRDQAQAIMGFKGATHVHHSHCGCPEREVFNPREIKMPKMVIKNATTVNPWYGGKHWARWSSTHPSTALLLFHNVIEVIHKTIALSGVNIVFRKTNFCVIHFSGRFISFLFWNIEKIPFNFYNFQITFEAFIPRY